MGEMRGLILMSLLLVAACGRAERPEPKREANVAPRPSVMVLAGDIVVINGEHIRLAGIVTPQPLPAARCWAEATAAKQVRLLVKSMTTDATDITVTRTGAKDPQGRTVAHVLLDGADLGDHLFSEGAAAKPADGEFRWCEPISQEREGAPNVLDLLTPMG